MPRVILVRIAFALTEVDATFPSHEYRPAVFCFAYSS